MQRPLHQVAGADPEPLQPAQGDADSLKILDGYRRLRQQAEVPLMHRTQLVAQLRPLFSQMNMDRTTVVGVRRDKAALSSGCKPHPAIRSSRKQSEQSWR